MSRPCDCRWARYVARWRGRLVASGGETKGRLVLHLNRLGRTLLAAWRRLAITVDYRERGGGFLEVDGFVTTLVLARPG